MAKDGGALPTVVRRRVGACVYCRTTEGPLSDEHIVPAGLNGNQVLAAACCAACQVKIGRFESQYLNSIRPVRAALGMGARRQKATRRTAPLSLTVGGVPREMHLPLDQHINAVALPVFERVPLPVGLEGEEELRAAGDPVVVHFGRRPEDVGRAHGASSISFSQHMPLVPFAKLLAKIAFCDAVQEWGLEAFLKVDPLDAMLGRKNDIGRWVGTAARETPAVASSIHTVQHRVSRDPDDPNGPIGVTSLVKLFSNTPAPLYEIVVGLLRPGTPTPLL